MLALAEERIEMKPSLNINAGGTVIAVFDPLPTLVHDLLEECKGSTPWYIFEGQCGHALGMKKAKLLNRKSRMTPELIDTVIDLAVPESTVTIEQMLAANGYIYVSEIKQVIFGLQPLMRERKDLRFKKNRPEEEREKYKDFGSLVEPVFHKDNMDEFIESYSYFILELTKDMDENLLEESMPVLRDICNKVSSNEAIARILHTYCFLKKQKEKQEDLNDAEETICFGTEPEIKKNKKSDSLFRVLKDLMFN